MAHFAELDQNNVVLRVLVTDNDDPNGDEGYKWLTDTFGGRWVKTSYNATMRGKFAAIGDIYDEVDDVFCISPETEAQAAVEIAEAAEAAAKRAVVLEALAGAAGVTVDEIKEVLGA